MIELIPAIDIIDGKCVRLTQGDYRQKTIYNAHPAEVAKMFAGVGIRRLHVVDLDGAKAQHIVNYKALESITAATDLTVDFGGGLKSDEDLRIAFECGASMVTGGSIAVKDEALFLRWIEKFGADKIILGADVKGGKIAVSGWTETTSLDLKPFLQNYFDRGLTKVICTDINKDGMLEGPAIDLYTNILRTWPTTYLIASGGVSGMKDIELLSEAGIPAVIFGKAFYEGKISPADLERWMLRTTN